MKRFKSLETQGLLRDEIIHKQSTLIQSSFNLLTETKKQAEANDNQMNEQIKHIKAMMKDILMHFRQFTYLYTEQL